MSSALLLPAATPQEMIDTQVPAARAILDAWQAQDPEPAERKLHLILWTPADREPAPRHRERLTAILQDIRDYYAGEMERLGFGPRTLGLDYADDGLLRVHLVRGRRPYADYGPDSGGRIRTESLPTLRAAGIDPDSETLVIFCNMSVWDEENARISQNSPYYAGGTHRSGNAWQVDSPILDLELLDRTEPMVRDGQYGRISVGRYNSIFIGGVAHELGHALGLPHNRERADEREAFGTALMGSGNRTYGEERRGEGKGSFLTLAHGLRLASHPMFSGSVKGIDIRANAVPSDLSIEPDGPGFVFSGRVTADPPVYGVVAYMDPEGGGDYDATTTTAVPDEEGRFTLHCHALEPGKSAELRVVFLQANGVASGFLSATPYRYPYSVAEDGTVDISAVRTRLLLEPVLAAVGRGDAAAAREALEDPRLEGEEAAEVAARIVASLDRELLEDIPAEVKSQALSEIKASEEQVGYGSPLRDRLPEPPFLLSSGGRIFQHGIYAHAPSSLRWELDGSWRSLRGAAGVADGREGSVRFFIEGDDGRVLWSSNLVRSGAPREFEVDLSGVTSLTLRTDDGGDGRAQDWSLWLEPLLERD